MKEKTVLIAIVGQSPAILTETVWALANAKKPVVPDEVVVLTTASCGKNLQPGTEFDGAWQKLRKDILAKGGAKCKGKLKCSATEWIRYFEDSDGKPLDDLRNYDENMAAAHRMLEVIDSKRGYRIYASIAGGRKTMSALMFSSMSLLGKKGDKILHVLASKEFEQSRKYYPTTKTEQDQVELFEVPFVALYDWCDAQGLKGIPGYDELVRRTQSGIGAPPRKIVFDVEARTVSVQGGTPRKLKGYLFVYGLVALYKGIDENVKIQDALKYIWKHHKAADLPKWVITLCTNGKVYDNEGCFGYPGSTPALEVIRHNLKKVFSEFDKQTLARLIPRIGDSMDRAGFDITCSAEGTQAQDFLRLLDDAVNAIT